MRRLSAPGSSPVWGGVGGDDIQKRRKGMGERHLQGRLCFEISP